MDPEANTSTAVHPPALLKTNFKYTNRAIKLAVARVRWNTGCAFFTAVHVVTCAYANFNPLYSLDCARAGRADRRSGLQQL